MKKNIFAKLSSCLLFVWGCTNLFAAEFPVGKRVRLLMKSGPSIEGTFLEQTGDDRVRLQELASAIEISKIEKVVVLETPLTIENQSVGDGERRRTLHRLSPLSLAMGNNQSFGLEIAAYDVIFPNGISFRLVPLNISGYSSSDQIDYNSEFDSYHYSDSFRQESVYYAPLWFRYYGRQLNPWVWPYIGIAFAYHQVDFNYGPYFSSSVKPAAEIGVDVGGKRIRCNLGGRFFQGEGNGDESLLLFHADCSIRFGRRL